MTKQWIWTKNVKVNKKTQKLDQDSNLDKNLKYDIFGVSNQWGKKKEKSTWLHQVPTIGTGIFNTGGKN